MRTFSSVFVLAALGVLGLAAGGAAAAPVVDTSNWKCESCPFEKGTSGSVELGAGLVSEGSAKYGDATGLDRSHAIVNGDLRWRGDEGLWADASASDLGLAVRTLSAQGGQDGVYKLQFGYSELPHRLYDTGVTPFEGVGGSRLTLPFGPAATTGAMPLATTQQAADAGFDRKRIEAAATLQAVPEWSWRVNVRRDKRDGLQRMGASFFSTSSQLLVPIDQATDEIEASGAYQSGTLRAGLGWQLSRFRNRAGSVTWDNPFTPVVAGATQGQLALAPSNDFHQVWAVAGWDPLPELQLSGEVAAGTMTQDAPFVDPTLNGTLGVTAADLPQASLQGKVNTFNGSLRATATPMAGLRLNASVAHDARDNRTPSNAYPALATDMFVGATERTNLPYDFKQDRLKVSADWRGPAKLNLAGGVNWDRRERSYQEVVDTNETTLWARGSRPLGADTALELKWAHGERHHSTYGTVIQISPPENPLLRKYNLADRTRDSVGARLDLKPTEIASVTLNADWAYDDYDRSPIGLTDSRTMDLGLDVGVAVSDDLQLRAYTQLERIRSRQAGSAFFAGPDWRADSRDDTNLLGLGLRQNLLNGKLTLDGDLTFARSTSRVAVAPGSATDPFPTASTTQDSLRLQAAWQVQTRVTLTGSWWYERYVSRDWHLDGVGPGTVSNLLALGDQPARYHVNVVRLAMRYSF